MKREDGLPASRGRLKELRSKKKGEQRKVAKKVRKIRTTMMMKVANLTHPKNWTQKNQPSHLPGPKP